MPNFKIGFFASGNTSTIVSAADEEDARQTFMTGKWMPSDRDWEFYHIDSVSETNEEPPDADADADDGFVQFSPETAARLRTIVDAFYVALTAAGVPIDQRAIHIAILWANQEAKMELQRDAATRSAVANDNP
jgi:hypothetical protein